MKKTIKKRVAEIFKEFQIDFIPVPVEKIAKKLGLSIISKKLEITVSGALIPDKKIILVNSTHHEHRKRFTIAHEIGHWLLHYPSGNHNLFIDESLTFYRDKNSSVSSPIKDKDEIDANSFAAELLMPEAHIKEYLEKNRVDVFDGYSTINLAAKFNVSEQAAIIRLQSIGVIAST